MTHAPTCRRFLGIALLCAFPRFAGAVDLVVTTNTSLPAGSYSYGSVLVKTGVTLTLAADTALGTGTTIDATTVTIEAGGAISADGQGYTAGLGTGAGSAGLPL